MVDFMPYITDVLKRLTDPKSTDNMDVFAYQTYAKWAVYELLNFVCDYVENGVSVDVAIGDFCELMEKYALEPNPSSYMFSIARDVAVSIADEFVMTRF